MMKRRPWRKNLYENNDYEDNYTDPSFLKDLRTNLHVRFYTYTEVMQGVTIVNNQISSITGFLIIFYLLYSEQVHPHTILWPSCIITILGYIIYRRPQLSIYCLIEDSKTLLAILVFGYIFTPVLHTLTDAISTDTIFSMTFFVMILNVVFYDYQLKVAMVSSAISLNAAIFGSICLASRLPEDFHAFVLLVIAAIIFVLYPRLIRDHWHYLYLIPIVTVCSYTLSLYSLNVLYIYLTVIVFINFLCPLIFVMLQHYKFNIHGPWDEAIVAETTADDYNF